MDRLKQSAAMHIRQTDWLRDGFEAYFDLPRNAAFAEHLRRLFDADITQRVPLPRKS